MFTKTTYYNTDLQATDIYTGSIIGVNRNTLTIEKPVALATLFIFLSDKKNESLRCINVNHPLNSEMLTIVTNLLKAFPRINMLNLAPTVDTITNSVIFSLTPYATNVITLVVDNQTFYDHGIMDQQLIAELSKWPNLKRLSLHGIHLGNKNAANLSELKQLEMLDVSSCKLTTQDVATWKKFSALRMLILDDNDISDAGLVPIVTSSPKLSTLRLNSCAITPVGIKTIVSNLPGLKKLSLGNLARFPNTLGLEGLTMLQQLTELQELNINFCSVTDHETKSLQSFTKLTALEIQDNNITEQGLQNIARLPNLATLSIDDNPIKSVQVLKQMASLRHVFLAETPLTQVEFIDLAKSNRNLHIIGTNGGDLLRDKMDSYTKNNITVLYNWCIVATLLLWYRANINHAFRHSILPTKLNADSKISPSNPDGSLIGMIMNFLGTPPQFAGDIGIADKEEFFDQPTPIEAAQSSSSATTSASSSSAQSQSTAALLSRSLSAALAATRHTQLATEENGVQPHTDQATQPNDKNCCIM